ncbi:MAG: DNA-methyltransferase, partial [Tepidisphaeraceae bacterium]
NLGDSYNAYNGGAGPSSGLSRGAQTGERPRLETGFGLRDPGLKPKDLCGTPWRVAFALQEDGWYLRCDVIWAKPNPMPESVTDRPTKSHEYVFLLTKSEWYWYNAAAIKEPMKYVGLKGQTETGYKDARNYDGKHSDKQRGHSRRHAGFNERWDGMSKEDQQELGANARSVWSIATQPYSEAHFATMPLQLAKKCILAGCPKDGVVLDPFMGAGTAALASKVLGRAWVGIELNTNYIAMAQRRLDGTPDALFAS